MTEKIIFEAKKGFFLVAKQVFFLVYSRVVLGYFLSRDRKTNICAKPKNRMRNSVLFLLKCKKRAHLWDQLFSVHFLVRNMAKIVPRQNKNRVFGKSTKRVFTVLKVYLCILNFSQK